MKTHGNLRHSKGFDRAWKLQLLLVNIQIQLCFCSLGDFFCGNGAKGLSALAYFQGQNNFLVLQILCKGLCCFQILLSNLSAFAF